MRIEDFALLLRKTDFIDVSTRRIIRFTSDYIYIDDILSGSYEILGSRNSIVLTFTILPEPVYADILDESPLVISFCGINATHPLLILEERKN